VAALYDFETLGLGSYTFEPITTFQVADSQDASLNKFKLSAADIAVEVKSDVARREIPTPTTKDKRSTVSCSNASQSSFIAASYTEGKALASIAASYISTNGANSLFTSYFKTTSTSTVRTKFTNVANENTSSRTLSCSDPYGVCTGGVIAYTLLSGVNPI
jgi:deuterolysin